MTVTVKFLGAAGTVTGSKYLVTHGKTRILVDAGMFQGKREWRERNWNDPEMPLNAIDAVLLTHAHIDHTGILPRFHAFGLKCPVYCTSPTHALAKLLLPDSGRLQEEEASYRSKKKQRSRHDPPVPLYKEADAVSTLKLFRTVKFDEPVQILEGVTATWRGMGHILGAASITLEIGGRIINFSGDIGRYSIPILRDPQPVTFGDLLLIESTYGSRLHPSVSPKELLAPIIRETCERGGTVVIPSFAVGRAQLILYYLRELKAEGAIPDVPVIIDSPMATDATAIYRGHPGCYDEAAREVLDGGESSFSFPKLAFTRDREDSIKLNSVTDPMVLISASGMLTGGRILHHLRHRITSPLNTIMFVGYQPPGGRGDWIQSGAESLRIFGEEVAIRAQIETISGLSAHADKDELLRWCSEGSGTPWQVAIVHGEPDSARSFQDTLQEKFGWNAFTAEYLQEITL